MLTVIMLGTMGLAVAVLLLLCIDLEEGSHLRPRD